MFSIKSKGNFNNLEKTLKKASDFDIDQLLNYYGKLGVEKLKAATPIDTGKTANSWYYNIEKQSGIAKIHWINDNTTQDGTPIIILLQYGHGTVDGAFIEGQDIVNPAIQDVIDELVDKVWKEVI